MFPGEFVCLFENSCVATLLRLGTFSTLVGGLHAGVFAKSFNHAAFLSSCWTPLPKIVT